MQMNRMRVKATDSFFSGLKLIAFISLLHIFSVSPVHAEENTLEDYEAKLDLYMDSPNYQSYLSEQNQATEGLPDIHIPATDYTRVEEMDVSTLEDFEGESGQSLLTGDTGLIEYEIEVDKSGFYEMSLLYYPIEGNSAAIQRSFFLNEELPYSELNLIEFPRIWVNNTDTWEKDNQGNDLRPSQVEEPEWMEMNLQDSNGYVVEPLGFYLEKGTHTLTILSQREPMVLKEIILKEKKKLLTYEEYLDQTDGDKSSNQVIEIQGESANRKSSQMLYPIQDQSSPAVKPYSAKELLNNTIGGINWRSVGQWIEWDFEVEETGYYELGFHAKQNFMRGSRVARRIKIDGEVPYKELNDYGFDYRSDWDMYTLADEEEEPYLIYLEEGTHTLQMEVILGELSTIVGEVEQAIFDLNAIYRTVIRITGVSPDEFRDYQIESSIPNLVEKLTQVRDELNGVLDQLSQMGGVSSEKEAVIITMKDQLDSLLRNPELFSRTIDSYKTNVSALGTWIMQVIEQPLQMDTLYFKSPDAKMPKHKSGIFSKVAHEAKKLYYSFIIDYNVIGNVADTSEETETITVWIGSGRDQANVLKKLADETFTYNTDINVNVELVDINTLLQATLAGQGPDVALGVANDWPMNYGLRNAVVDLSEFQDIETIKDDFFESAWEPYIYDNDIYGLPETQTFPMMFYRKDILSELNLELPETWDDMKVALSVLSKNQMDLGMLPTEQTYSMLLYQNGGEYYHENGALSAVDSEEGIKAFREFTEYYSDYTLDRETNIEQRFRTGESPIIISDYTTYNNLMVSAPDIRGLWGFTTVPGTIREDGTIDKTVTTNGVYMPDGRTSTTAAVMMEGTSSKENSWEFLKWWVSEEAQTAFGKELESLMGAAARYPTANKNAFEKLPWPTRDYQALSEQMESLRGIPQVPGGYFTWRNVNNAFYRTVVNKNMAPREALTEYVRYINDEIAHKRNEFNMDIFTSP